MNYEEWKKWWEIHSPEYFTDKIWRFSRPELIAKLGIKKKSKVLELGFGYGRELSQFCKLSDFVYGLELTEFACDNTLQYFLENSILPLPYLHQYDGLNLPEGRTYDVIYSCFVVQHISKEHAKQLCKNCLEALNPGGKILFEFFGDPMFHHETEDVMSQNEEWGDMFNNAYEPHEIKNMLESIGAKTNWIETQKITKEWGNHWVCFSR